MIKRTTLLLAASLLPASAQLPAFPGAQGFGAYATGGRGGDVYAVTNLNGSGAGSLRYGVETAPASGRTIVFAVSGYIPLPGGNLRIVQNKVTIAGQTAPGDGIGLRDGTLRVTGNNTVIRNLRIRHGKNGSGGDCLNVDSTATQSIIDQVTMQFSTDENISFFNSALDNFTMQNSVTAWGLESHNAGGLWDLNRGSCHNSLWAHHHTRNPKARPSGLLEWANNVTFDWGIGFIMGDSETPAPWKANVRGCYFISPPGRTDNTALEKGLIDRNGYPNFSLYLNDCLHDSDGDGLLNGTNKGYSIVAGSEYNPAEGAAPGTQRHIRAASPFAGSTGNSTIILENPLTAFKKVVSNAGAVRLDAAYSGPLRDEVDTVLFNNVATQKPSRITRESDLAAAPFNVSNSGFGTLNSAANPTDSDLDGMPDYWEQALGFSPAMANNNTVFANNGSIITAATFFPPNTPSGYTHLEEYLHFLSVPHATIARNIGGETSVLTADLRKFTSGFSKSPTFGLSGLTGGAVAQFAADGTTPSASGPIVKFTPTLNVAGRAGFNFTVLDADGSSWTRQFAILVSTAGVPRDLLWIGGNNSNAWDAVTPNWQKTSGEAVAFSDGDNALLDDRGSVSPAIVLAGSISPGSVVISGTKNYTIGGTGTLASVGSLTKTGDTTLVFNRSATFAGGTFLSGGNTILAPGATLDGGGIRFIGGSTLTSTHTSSDSDTLTLNPALVVDVGAVGNINLSQRVNLKGSLSGGGTFNIFSPSNLGTEGRVYLDGASAGCTGNVNLSGGGNGRIAFRANGGGFNGFNNARVDLNGISIFTTNGSGGNTYALGSLSGTANSVFAGAYLGGPTTLNIGGLGLDSGFAGVFKDGGTGITALTKSGAGTLTLTGTSLHTGLTTVSAGTLALEGAFSASPVTVASGAILIGNGSFGGLITVNSGGKINPGNAATSFRALPANGGLTVASGTLIYDLSSDPNGLNDKITVAAGTFTNLSGTVNFQLNFIDGSLGAGTYKLIDGGANQSVSGLTMNAVIPAPAGTTRQTFGLSRTASGATPGWVNLTVTGNAGNLTWTGANGGIWDLNTTVDNWSGASPNTFRNLDLVTFADGATTGSVNLAGTLEPARITATNSSLAYTLTGSGSIGGGGRLIKNGGGILTIANTTSNSYSGGTTLNAGTLVLGNATGMLGSGPVAMNGGTLQLPNTPTFLGNSMVFSGISSLTSPYAGNSTLINNTASTLTSVGSATLNLVGLGGILSINGDMSGFSGAIRFGSSSGMVRLNSNSSAAADVNRGSANTLFDLGSGTGKLVNRNGNITIQLGALSGGLSTNLGGRQSGSGDTSSTYVIGGLNSSTSFSGSLTHNGDLGGLRIVKIGSGNLTLGGNSDFIGAISVEAGALTISGNTATSGSTQVDAGAALALEGGSLGAEAIIVEGSISGYGGIISDLNCMGTFTGRGFASGVPGTLSVSGSAYFDSASLTRLRSGGAGDVIAISSDLTLAGAVQIQLAPGTTFGRYPIFTYGGNLTSGAVALVGIPGGTTAQLSTGMAGRVDLVIDDSDEDGLPDSWETQFLGGLASGPDDDSDGDGQKNSMELLTGTNPGSGASRFAATLTPAAAGQFTLTWPSVPGKSYQILTNDSLQGAWSPLVTLPAADSPATSTSYPVTMSVPRRFYRVALLPVP